MANRMWYGFRWFVLATLTGGLLLQSACATSLATGTAGLLSSITTQFVRNIVYKSMGLDPLGFSFGT